jgi:hypothetical protein
LRLVLHSAEPLLNIRHQLTIAGLCCILDRNSAQPNCTSCPFCFILYIMGFFGAVKNRIFAGLGGLFRRPKKSLFPLADRLLADALLLGGIPSPAAREEERAAFVSERLRALAVPHTVDEGGNILVRLHGNRSAEPLLLFAGLGSGRWNPQESLGHLDSQYARGAGLADALGPAALLSVAENYVQGTLVRERDVLLFFSASGFDDPAQDAFLAFTGPKQRPFAALGLRGFALGSLYNPVLGSCRVEIKLSLKPRKDGEAAPRSANLLTGALVNMASGYLNAPVPEEQAPSGKKLSVNIRRIEAQTSYGRFPEEGALELVLEGADKEELDRTLENIRLETERRGAGETSAVFSVLSNIPPSDPAFCAGLFAALKNAMKELRIKCTEETGAGPSSFLTNMGIPALSLGLAGGREGLEYDTVEIATVEKGRLLLEKCVALLSREDALT